ncbi:MAG TPA: glycoside hydrolase family 32 protein [Mucilaginibacter sp.]|jgi:fructan beta-fructosidase
MAFKRFFAVVVGVSMALFTRAQIKPYNEPYRPQVHFSPREKWMNDPNGMVYYKGVYHLFFQHYPKDIVWGPMHWGHAVSKDLMHWKQLPIALYPDSLGYIFSGSAVIDYKNTSGFGKNGQIPMVAIFTHHNPILEKAGSDKFQNESIAYSLDEGNTWTKYPGNPVLKNPGIRDFRDPKVSWYARGNKWLMTLATKDRISFYSSPNLKDWTKESEFGKSIGGHGGVWECPDLFPLKLNDKTYWVLLVSINPGGPNGGSATQYFIGDFDGKTFTPLSTKIKWIDYGPDDYAGATWANTGDRRIFLGWMSNWLYANQVPTKAWRNAMTVPRELALKQVGNDILLTSNPVKEIESISSKVVGADPLIRRHLPAQYILSFHLNKITDYSVLLSNEAGEELTIGYSKANNSYFIDRSKSGKIDFSPEFVKPLSAPRLLKSQSSGVMLVADASSVELFADGGLTNMSAVFFPRQKFDRMQIKTNDGVAIKNVNIKSLRSIWK